MHRTPLAALVLASLAPLAFAQVGSTTDLWDHSRGARVTDHSPFDDTHRGYDARDAFGGNYHDFPAALGAVIFADYMPEGSIHFIEWRTAAPIDLERIMVAVASDTHEDTLRATSAFRLLARDEPGAPWMLLYERTRDPQDVRVHPIWTIDHEFKAARRQLLEFRAEFTQACPRIDYGGPRVLELDGFGEYSLAAAPPPIADGRVLKAKIGRRR